MPGIALHRQNRMGEMRVSPHSIGDEVVDSPGIHAHGKARCTPLPVHGLGSGRDTRRA